MKIIVKEVTHVLVLVYFFAYCEKKQSKEALKIFNKLKRDLNLKLKMVMEDLNKTKVWRQMFKLFRKSQLSAIFALLTFSTMGSLVADECCSSDCCSSGCNRIYIGVFGGELFSNSPEMRQTGTAFFLEAAGGPLAVDARGDSNTTSPGFGGIQLGYEWAQCPFYIGCSDWSVTTAVEAEALFYSEKRRGDLINIAQARLDEHDFHDSFRLDVGVYVANAVFKLNSPCFGRFAPYVGIGIGAAHLSARNADSLQVSPPEAGVNHFNSKRNDSDWTLAVQAKAGIQYCFCEYLRFFAEYRYLSLDPTRYTFGSTVYPAHAATSPWDVDLGRLSYNAFAFGIQYSL